MKLSASFIGTEGPLTKRTRKPWTLLIVSTPVASLTRRRDVTTCAAVVKSGFSELPLRAQLTV